MGVVVLRQALGAVTRGGKSGKFPGQLQTDLEKCFRMIGR